MVAAHIYDADDSTFDTPSVFGGLVLLAAVGVIVNSLLNVFEAHALRWSALI